MSVPATRTEPASMRSRPAMQLSSVDLPTPDSPTTATNSPAPRARSATARTGSANATRLDELARDANDAGDRIGVVAGDDLAPRHRAEPGQLPFRELAGGGGRRRHDGREVAGVERRPRLSIADRAHRR